jgi:hypothetical protein
MELQKTNYKELDEFPGYFITNCGRVWTNYYNKFMINQIRKGYARINLKKDGKTKQMFVHRLVALAFIPNYENKKEVNHIDGDKLNNNVKNLEWCTPKENTKHAYDNGFNKNVIAATKKSNSKRVLDTRSGLYYDSAKEAAECKHINYGTLRNMLNGHDRNKTSLIYA